MASTTPKRPIVYRFVFGKGLVKARQDSSDTSRLIVDQVTISYVEETFEDAKKVLIARIHEDVTSELGHTVGQYKKFIIGASGRNPKARGTLTAVTKTGASSPKANLAAMLPTWAPRGAAYLARKKDLTGATKWFDNTGWGQKRYEGGGLREFFASVKADTASGYQYIHNADIFEDMFGDVSVQILRNNKPNGRTRGYLSTAPSSKTKVQIQIGTVRVRALGSVTNAMLNAYGGYNGGLLSLVKAHDAEVAYKLGGGRAEVYRPTLEPFLQFFLQRSLPYAVRQRLSKGTLKSIFR